MGHYTIRTNDDEDQAIKKAQEATGQASASKTFMTAILELQRNSAAKTMNVDQRTAAPLIVQFFGDVIDD